MSPLRFPYDPVPVAERDDAPRSVAPAGGGRFGCRNGRREAAALGQGVHAMPIWTVQVVDGEDERVDADLLGTDGGALVALSEEGLMLRAWAAGHWQTVRLLTGPDAHP